MMTATDSYLRSLAKLQKGQKAQREYEIAATATATEEAGNGREILCMPRNLLVAGFSGHTKKKSQSHYGIHLLAKKNGATAGRHT